MVPRDNSPEGSRKPARPVEAPDLATSVAGEEDPGAAIDMTQPGLQQGTPHAPEAPRDAAPAAGRKPGGA